MIFTSFDFVLFILPVLLLYNLVPSAFRARFLLIAGYSFYAYSGLPNVIILLAVTLSSFLFGKAIGSTRRFPFLIFGIFTTVAPLIAWKVGLVGTVRTANDIVGFVIPLGLSFYTLQAIGYLFDVFRQHVRPEDSISTYALFLAFFPILLAGPVERAGRLLPQFRTLPKTKMVEAYTAGKQFLWGLICKLVIADKMAIISSELLNRPEDRSAIVLLTGLVIFAVHIYFDFYGYSTIAVALARLFGVQVMANFNNPLLASNLVDFWHRWHISLSTWFRDYVYLPIGYRLKQIYAFTFLVLLVFILSGLWHGTSLCYLAWGLIHGILYIVGRLTLKIRRRVWKALLGRKLVGIHRITETVFILILTSLVWVFFAVPNIATALLVVSKIFSANLFVGLGMLGKILLRGDYLFYIVCAISLFIVDSSGLVNAVVNKLPMTKKEVARELALVNSLVLLLIFIGGTGARGFFYMRF